MSKHLTRLIDAGLVERKQVGRYSYHHVIHATGVAELLAAAAQLCASTGRDERNQ